MRRPNILDVVSAVTEVAPDHPDVSVWWYAPEPELRVRGLLAEESLEIVLEIEENSQPDLGGISSDLSDRLRGSPVKVRHHLGREESVKLFRMLTA